MLQERRWNFVGNSDVKIKLFHLVWKSWSGLESNKAKLAKFHLLKCQAFHLRQMTMEDNKFQFLHRLQ